MKRLLPEHLSVTHAQKAQQANTIDVTILEGTPTLTANIGISLLNLFSQHYQSLYGIGVVEWRVMAALAEAPDSRLRTICDALIADKGAVSRALGKLKEKGLITGKNDQWHTCHKYWRLTPAGRALHDVIFTENQRLNEALLNNVSHEQISVFHQVLQQLKYNINVHGER